jgi:hypothetical protein
MKSASADFISKSNIISAYFEREKTDHVTPENLFKKRLIETKIS